MPAVYSPSMGQWLDAATGLPMSHAELTGIRDAFLDTVSDELRALVDELGEPEPVAAGRYDLMRLTQDVEDVRAQLRADELEPGKRPEGWRRKATAAERSKGRRVAFLQYWLAEQIGDSELAALRAVLHAAEHALADDSAAAWDDLADEVARAKAA